MSFLATVLVLGRRPWGCPYGPLPNTRRGGVILKTWWHEGAPVGAGHSVEGHKTRCNTRDMHASPKGV